MKVLWAIWAFVMFMWLNLEKFSLTENYLDYRKDHYFLGMVTMLILKTGLDLFSLVIIGLTLWNLGIIK